MILLILLGVFAMSLILFPTPTAVALVALAIHRVVHRRQHRFDAFVGAMLS